MITGVRLQRFRSYDDASFEIDQGVNIIVGPNASGKTSLLEAVLFGALGSSYRARDIELIKANEPWSRIDLETTDGERTVKLMTAGESTTKEYVIYGQKLKRLSLQKSIPVVLFEPDHLQLLTGSPDKRRDFLDDLLAQTVPGYDTLRKQYRRTLAQRNRLLKQGKHEAGQQLFAWNIRLSQLGGQIAAQRHTLVQRMASDVEKLYERLSGSRAEISVVYQTKCVIEQYSSDMLHKLEQSMDSEFERGYTLYGPHRDDMAISLHGKPLEDIGSRGEVRTILLALKIKELEVVEEVRGQKPLLLLDDVFSELDGSRRRSLTEVVKNYQAFITTTDADVVVEHFLGKCNVIALTTE